MANALVLRIATDATAASRGVTDLAVTVGRNMSTISSSIGNVSQGAIPGMAIATGVASSSMGNSLLQIALRFAQLRAAWIVGGVAIAGALAGARAELERFADILDKAQASNVSTTFFQAFTQAADEAKVKVETLEKALRAVQPNITDRLDDPARAREVLESTPFRRETTALDDFNSAPDREGRIRALLTAINDLNKAYRETGDVEAALARNRVAELFGPEFAEQVRRGTLEVEKFKENLDRLYADGAGGRDIVPAETLQRIKDLDDRVGAVDRSIRDSLRPAFDDLAAAMLNGRQAGVLLYEALGGLVRRAAELYGAAKLIAAAFASLPSRIANPAGGTEGQTIITYDPLGNVTGSETVAARRSQAGDRDLSGPFSAPEPPPPPEPPPAPGPPPGDPRKRRQPPPDTSRADQIERYIETLEKEVRVVEAEAETFGKSNAEKARANALARIGADEVTPAQIRQIEELTDRQTKARESTERLRQAQDDYNNVVRLAGTSISGFLSDIVSGGRNAEEALSNLAKKLADAVLQAQLLGDGPLAGLLGTRGQNGAPGGLLGSLFAGFRQSSAATPVDLFNGGAAIFAKGGVMGAAGPLSLRAYSSGGVATGPQLALFGEGAHREAYVPLPDGRSIPVTLNVPDSAGLGSSVQSAPAPVVLVYNSAPQARIATGSDSAGNLMVIVEDAMAAAAAKPGGVVQSAFAAAFGLNPAAGVAR